MVGAGQLSRELDRLFIACQQGVEHPGCFSRREQRFGGPLVLFGAGATGRKALEGLRRIPGSTVVAFCDNDSGKWGSLIDGLPVLAPEDAVSRFGRWALFIVTICSPGHSYLRTEGVLARMGCDHVVPVHWLFWTFPHVYSPHYQFDTPESTLRHSDSIRAAADLLGDPRSRSDFIALVRLRLLGDFRSLLTPAPHQYFPPDCISLSKDEVFVDCGAYNGDTLSRFLAQVGGDFEAAIAFEPASQSYAKLCDFVSGLPATIRQRITLVRSALKASNGWERMSNDRSAGAHITETGQIAVNAVRLDDYLADKAPTFLKLDVEGSEMEALRGAECTITRHRPTIAVCAYHNPEHFWQIPLFLRALNPEYRFHFRSHSADGWEQVWYTVDDSR